MNFLRTIGKFVVLFLFQYIWLDAKFQAIFKQITLCKRLIKIGTSVGIAYQMVSGDSY